MNDLIERLEKATGPDRELDSDIMRLAFEAEVWSYDDNSYIDHLVDRGLWSKARDEHPDYDPEPYVTWRYRRGGLPGTDPAAEYGDIPEFTSSIDAAMTMIPDRLRMLSTFGEDVSLVTLHSRRMGDPDGVWHESVKAKTPALAICIAALKVRAAMKTGQSDSATNNSKAE